VTETQGPADMLLLPGHWGHATVNSGFTIGIGNLYCDGHNAIVTHDEHCRRFYPAVASRGVMRDRQNGGTANVLDRYVDGVWWVDQLGALAPHGDRGRAESPVATWSELRRPRVLAAV